LRINLESAQIDSAISERFLKVVADDIGTQPADEGHGGSKSRQRTSHIGWSPAEAIITILWISRGGVTTQWSESINESLTETKHLRRGIGHQTCDSFQQRGQKSLQRQAAQSLFG